jgi:hypothetical protein
VEVVAQEKMTLRQKAEVEAMAVPTVRTVKTPTVEEIKRKEMEMVEKVEQQLKHTNT